MNPPGRLLAALLATLLILLAGAALAIKLRRPDAVPAGEQGNADLQPQTPHALSLAEPGWDRVLEQLAARTGVTPDLLRRHLADLRLAARPAASGVAVDGLRDGAPVGAPVSAQRPVERQTHRPRPPSPRDLEEAVARGLRLARQDDDYGRVGLEHEEFCGAETIEVELIDETVRDRLELTGKLVANLQEMLREGEFPRDRALLADLLARLSEASGILRENLTRRASLRLDELGSRADRQLHAFRTGVVEHLRQRGLLPELRRLYRAGTTRSALDYSVEEALPALWRQCPQLAALERRGITALLAASTEELTEALWPALTEGESGDEDVAGSPQSA